MTARRLLRLLGLVAASALAATQSVGQAADTLVWEPVGDIQQVRWLAFDADTLYAGTRSWSDQGRDLEIGLLRPGADSWTRAYERPLYADDFGFYLSRIVFGRWNRILVRSVDGGVTFSGETEFDGVFSLPVRVPDGGLVVGYDSATRPAARSEDDGLTWTVHDGPDLALTPTHLEVLPPTPGLPAGRVVGAGYGGIGYSDDGGRTWAPTNFSGGGGIAFAAWALARVAQGPRDGGHGGALLAVVEGNGGIPPTVHRSSDGVAWEAVVPTPQGIGYTARLLAGPDGSVYLYSVVDDLDYEALPVWRSTDGGATWDDMGPLWTGWRAYPTELAVGPDGHLWASAMGEYRYGHRVGGVFRTPEPAFAVSSEAAPAGPEHQPPGLRVFPNPAAGPAAVQFDLSVPSSVRISVHDAAGREVAVIHDGPVADGQRVAIDTAGWAAGVYVVRAEAADGTTASAAFTVAR